MTMTRSTLALLLAALALPATAQTIYRCTDANGGMLISNTRVDKSCKAVVSSPDSTLPAPKTRASGAAAANPSPAGFPRVQEDTQKARDTDRKRILEQELAGEQRSLDQAQRELAEQQSVRASESPASRDRVQPYRDRVAQHERNIVAIQKELSSLR
jgi:DNA polymerase III delta prime subunit